MARNAQITQIYFLESLDRQMPASYIEMGLLTFAKYRHHREQVTMVYAFENHLNEKSTDKDKFDHVETLKSLRVHEDAIRAIVEQYIEMGLLKC